MRLFKNDTFWLGSFYFVVLLGIALWVRDIQGQQDSFNTIQQLMAASGMGDPVSFATAAIDIAKNGWISTANDWIFNLWPPGFILLEALILKLFGFEVQIILILQILASLLFSVILVLIYQTLKKNVNCQFAMALPLVIFAFPVSRVFLLEPTGVTLGENFAIGFFLLAILLAFRAVEQNSIRNAVYAGLCLALSAYFRSQFDIILWFLTGCGMVLLIAIKLTRLKDYIVPTSLKASIKTIIVILMVAHATALPWRIYHYINQGVPAWVSTPKLVFANSVISSQELNSKGGGFVVAGGGNLVCRIDPATCGDAANANKLFVKTFVENPVEWYALKFDVIGKYWFSSVKNWVNVSVEPTSIDMVANGLLLFALIVMVVLLFTRQVRSHRLWLLLLWYNSALFSSYLLIFTIVHFEVRYFYFPKIAGIVMLIIVIGIYFRPINKIDTFSKVAIR